MAKYNIEITRSAAKEIYALSKREAVIIMNKISHLSNNPRPVGCQKLSGQERYRIRSGNYRVVYSIDDVILIVCVVKVGHRKNVYQ